MHHIIILKFVYLGHNSLICISIVACKGIMILYNVHIFFNLVLYYLNNFFFKMGYYNEFILYDEHPLTCILVGRN